MNILSQMKLRSLSFDFFNLNCSSGCCRREALQSCLVFLGSNGPWYRWEREGGVASETNIETKVRVLGLKNDEEKKLFWQTWGLKVE